MSSPPFFKSHPECFPIKSSWPLFLCRKSNRNILKHTIRKLPLDGMNCRCWRWRWLHVQMIYQAGITMRTLQPPSSWRLKGVWERVIFSSKFKILKCSSKDDFLAPALTSKDFTNRYPELKFSRRETCVFYSFLSTISWSFTRILFHEFRKLILWWFYF